MGDGAVPAHRCGLSLLKATRISRARPFARWFYVAFLAFCLFATLEEISWGQRIAGFRSPEFFRKHARQGETNVHNVLERLTKLTTKDYAAAAFLLYGVCLPIAVSRSRRVKAFVERVSLKMPPLFLIPGFALAALLPLDRPTGREEELGELFFSLCASLFMLKEVLDDTGRGP